MSSRAAVAFLFDVDNTLLDNDRVKAEMAAGIEAAVGSQLADQFWELYEEVRAESEVVDLPATLERFEEAYHGEPGALEVIGLIMGYPFEKALYPGALAALAHVQEVGPAGIVTDGDPGYQPVKIARAGLTAAVNGRVYISVHKEERLAAVQRAMPADRYVLFDDKLALLNRVEMRHASVLTVHVRQGHYADQTAGLRPADRTLERIGDLVEIDLAAFLGD
ncbi:MAG TPA: HAD family hydrolase [Candidatus Limnocylindria bacterium]